MATAAHVPAHVPADLVMDCPIAERTVYRDNVFETRIAPMHASMPAVYYCPNIYPTGEGGWVVRKVADLKEIYADDELYSKEGFSGFSALIGETWSLVPTELVGSKHRSVRKVLNPEFAPQKMFALDDIVRNRALDLVGKFKARGSCDFVAEFAVPFPVSIFLDLFGLPQDEVGQFLMWEHALLHGTDMQARMTATREVKVYLLDAIQQRREKPRNDLISFAIDYEYDGQPWTNEMVFGYCFNLFVGGLDTVSANIGLHVYHLAHHPDQQAQLRANPGLLTLAIEEMLRAYAAVTTYRTVKQEVEFRGVKMMPGDKIAMSTAISSRDPEAWPEPNIIDFDRKPGHLAFGSSSHRCLGMHLARRELIIALETILAELPEFRIAPGKDVPMWLGNIIQCQALPLVWG
jgi:cytochrome P450